MNGHTYAPFAPSPTARSSSRAAACGSLSEMCAVGTSRGESAQNSVIHRLYALVYAWASAGSCTSASHSKPTVVYRIDTSMCSASITRSRSDGSIVPYGASVR